MGSEQGFDDFVVRCSMNKRKTNVQQNREQQPRKEKRGRRGAQMVEAAIVVSRIVQMIRLVVGLLDFHLLDFRVQSEHFTLNPKICAM